MSEIAYKYFYSLLVFNLLFSTFGYAFTVWETTEPPDLNLGIDTNQLIEAGFFVVNGTVFNMTFDDSWHYFTLADQSTKGRVKWGSQSVYDGFVFQYQNIVEAQFDTWIVPFDFKIDVKRGSETVETFEGLITNSSVIDFWNFENQWLSLTINQRDHAWIITTPADSGNITKAIYETGEVRLIIGELEITNDFTLDGFTSWYFDNMFNLSFDGFPSILGWLVKIILALNFVTGVIILRDLTKV